MRKKKWIRYLSMTFLIFSSFSFFWQLTAQERKDSQGKQPWEAIPGPKELVEEVGPPAMVPDWERNYPQYQPVGRGDTEQAPELKPGTPNPPNIFRFGGTGKSSFIFDLSPAELLEKVIEREKARRSQIQLSNESYWKSAMILPLGLFRGSL